MAVLFWLHLIYFLTFQGLHLGTFLFLLAHHCLGMRWWQLWWSVFVVQIPYVTMLQLDEMWLTRLWKLNTHMQEEIEPSSVQAIRRDYSNLIVKQNLAHCLKYSQELCLNIADISADSNCDNLSVFVTQNIQSLRLLLNATFNFLECVHNLPKGDAAVTLIPELEIFIKRFCHCSVRKHRGKFKLKNIKNTFYCKNYEHSHHFVSKCLMKFPKAFCSLLKYFQSHCSGRGTFPHELNSYSTNPQDLSLIINRNKRDSGHVGRNEKKQVSKVIKHAEKNSVSSVPDNVTIVAGRVQSEQLLSPFNSTTAYDQLNMSTTTPYWNNTEYQQLLADLQLKRLLARNGHWAYLCVVFLFCLTLGCVWYMRGFHNRMNNKREITLHSETHHMLTVKEVLWRRRKYLPMFNSDDGFEEVFVRDCGTDP